MNVYDPCSAIPVPGLPIGLANVISVLKKSVAVKGGDPPPTVTVIDPELLPLHVKFVGTELQDITQPYSSVHVELHEFTHPVVVFVIVHVTVTDVVIVAGFINARIKGAVPTVEGVAPAE